MTNGYCPECGAEHEGVTYCPECGTKIGEHGPTDTETDNTFEPGEDDIEADTVDDEGGLNITLGKIVAYIVGPFLILSALGALGGGDFISGILILIAGIIALPIVRATLKEQQGISLSRWATVAIVVIFVVSGAAFAGVSGDNGTDSMGPEDGDQEQVLIDKPATELVIQLDQLGSGWIESEHDGNETHAVGEYFNSGDSAFLGTTADRYDNVDTADEEYETRVDEVEERYGTDTVDVGDEAILYSIGDSVWVIFRDKNVVAEVHYDEEFATDPEGEAINYAEMMKGNFRS